MAKESICNAGDIGDMGLITGSGKISWRWKWQPAPVFLPGKFHEPRSLADYSPWCHKELNRTERLSTPKKKKKKNEVYELNKQVFYLNLINSLFGKE